MSTKEMLEKILANENVTEDVKEKAKEMLASIGKRNDKRKEKSAENKTANNEVAEEIASLMNGDRYYAISEIVEELIPDTTLNKNKISAIMVQGVKDGLFEDTKEYKVGGKGRYVKGYRLANPTQAEETDTDETEETDE